ncbi:MAG TPA: SDR family oxidoreductase [Cytophagaceae bacterium]|jgi:3-hydroxy acid dehydrogenase/malonic semialdehyde reductase|nr:SDR family oxidoreductase [Cytophagaceae bacterium]
MQQKDRTIIISGCGYKTATGYTLSEHSNVFNDPGVKVNIGSATAQTLAESGYNLILISKTQDKLNHIKKSLVELFPGVAVTVFAIDLLNESEVRQLMPALNNKQTAYHYVHCTGISSGSYKIKDDNPYLSIEETPVDLPTIEFEAVVKSLLIMTQTLLPVFKQQPESRIVVVSSMSSVRSVPFGFSHTSAKAGLHNASRSLALELNKMKIYVSEVMPGAVDTGMYDNDIVKKRIIEMAKMFGYDYDEIPMMPSSAVAESVKMCLESKSHILAINMVAQGQWPNLGS